MAWNIALQLIKVLARFIQSYYTALLFNDIYAVSNEEFQSPLYDCLLVPSSVEQYESSYHLHMHRHESQPFDIVHMYLPGAAHMSKTISPGWGFKTWLTTMDGKFWGKATSLISGVNVGATYLARVISTATPLQVNSVQAPWVRVG